MVGGEREERRNEGTLRMWRGRKNKSRERKTKGKKYRK